MPAPALSVENLSFSYNGRQTLQDIFLNIEEGEYVSVIGPNGAGKSTLLKCINRILKAPEGTVKLFGREVSAYGQKEIGRLTGYVAQNCDHLFPYSVYEFVLMGRYPYLRPLSRASGEDKKIVEETLRVTGTAGFASRQVRHLSGGERQKVYLAGALAQRPKILLLDEPTAHLDPKFHMEIQQLITQIAREFGITVLHVTHDLNYILSWSTKVVAVNGGRCALEGRPQEVLTRENLRKIFDTEFFLLDHPSRPVRIIVPEEKAGGEGK